MKVLVPNKNIREKSKDVTSSKFNKCIRNAKKMIKLCNEKHESGIGLSAVQVGILKRFFIVKINNDKWEIFINPVIVKYSTTTTSSLEGCLSFPGESGTVKRSQKIRLKYNNEDGDEIHRTFKHQNAIVIQHEYDHCNGIVIVDKFIRKLNDKEQKC